MLQSCQYRNCPRRDEQDSEKDQKRANHGSLQVHDTGRIPAAVIILCMCPSISDTVSRSGIFCAIATTIEWCKTEGVVDVFQVVKALRVQKPGAIRTVVSVLCYVDIAQMPASCDTCNY